MIILPRAIAIVLGVTLIIAIQYGGHLNHLTWWFQLLHFVYICSWLLNRAHTTIVTFVALQILVALGVCAESFVCTATQGWLDSYGFWVFASANYMMHYLPIQVIIAILLPTKPPINPHTQLANAAGIVLVYIMIGNVNHAYSCNQHNFTITAAGTIVMVLIGVVFWLAPHHANRMLTQV
jgi:hypothetical protein